MRGVERQRDALAAVGELAAVLAHEVRNPLTSIRIDLQHVEERLPPDSPLRASLGRALREVHRLDRTVNGVLRIARSGAIAPGLVDLRVPVRRAVEVALAAFDQRAARLRSSRFTGASVPVLGDEAALEQVFLNLLLNAAQALAPGGEARVAVALRGRLARVEIRDGGTGIPADRLARVFDPFYSTRRDGTGLGLSVARQIVHAHGGTIAITSEDGTGTTVVVELPAREGGAGDE
jgi:signal transduction histidine kinase